MRWMLPHRLHYASLNAPLQKGAPAKDPPGPSDLLIFRVTSVAGSPALLLTQTPHVSDDVLDFGVGDLLVVRGHLVLALYDDVRPGRVRFFLHFVGTDIPRLGSLTRSRFSLAIRPVADSALRLEHLLSAGLILRTYHRSRQTQ